MLQEAVNLEPKRPELFLYLGTALQRAKAVRPGRRGAAGGAVASTTSRRTCTSSSAWCYEKQQRFDDAVREFRRVIVIDPKHAEAYNYIGYMYAEKGTNLDEAIELIKQGAGARARERLLHRQPRLGLLPAGPLSRGPARAEARGRPGQGRPGPLRAPGRRLPQERLDEDAATAWEKSLQLDPAARPCVKKKLDDLRAKMRRVQGERSKASQ